MNLFRLHFVNDINQSRLSLFMISEKIKINIGRNLLALYVSLLAITFSHHHTIVFFSDNNGTLSPIGSNNHNNNSSSHNALNCLIHQFSATGYYNINTSDFSVKFDTDILNNDKESPVLFPQLHSLSLLRAPPSQLLS